MNLGVEASLFRQVPSAHALTHTDMLCLHVRYMPALYIASKHFNMSCRVLSLAYKICLHEIHDARCANCKGKMANGSEISGAFWLLDSGASRHFTGDLGDFMLEYITYDRSIHAQYTRYTVYRLPTSLCTHSVEFELSLSRRRHRSDLYHCDFCLHFTSYQALKHKHYAKMENGVAEIAGIGTVLLQCLDHNTGDEKVVKLTQVLHMPGASACLISMGKMLLCNYRVTGDKKGISLIGEAN